VPFANVATTLHAPLEAASSGVSASHKAPGSNDPEATEEGFGKISRVVQRLSIGAAQAAAETLDPRRSHRSPSRVLPLEARS
jgi:hypothetical protein